MHELGKAKIQNRGIASLRESSITVGDATRGDISRTAFAASEDRSLEGDTRDVRDAVKQK